LLLLRRSWAGKRKVQQKKEAGEKAIEVRQRNVDGEERGPGGWLLVAEEK